MSFSERRTIRRRRDLDLKRMSLFFDLFEFGDYPGGHVKKEFNCKLFELEVNTWKSSACKWQLKA